MHPKETPIQLDPILLPPPERRVSILLNASADSFEDLADMLVSIGDRLMDAPESGTATSEVFGAAFSISDKGENYTHQDFRDELSKWQESRAK